MISSLSSQKAISFQPPTISASAHPVGGCRKANLWSLTAD